MARIAAVAFLLAYALTANADGSVAGHPPCVPSHGSGVFRLQQQRLLQLCGGEVSEYLLKAAYTCNTLFSEVLKSASQNIATMQSTVESGQPVPALGEKAESMVTAAVDRLMAASPEDGTEEARLFAEKKEQLQNSLHTQLNAVFVKQLQLLKEQALEKYLQESGTQQGDLESVINADTFFVKEATASMLPGFDWSYAAERTQLQSTMQKIAGQRQQTQKVRLQAAQQQSSVMQYLQLQQAQMQALQQQQFGQSQSGQWNLGAAYRPPDSNINLSLGYQQGRTNIQVSMVPDEQASLLGTNGFTAGVGPANLGVSFNVNV